MSHALEAGLEVLRPVMRTGQDKEALIAAKCLGLLQGYDERWKNAPYRIDGVEAVLSSPLLNPETQRRSRSFSVYGKIDVRATEIGTGAKVIFDHKTTSEEISDPNAPYWRQLVIEGQATHYMLLEWLNGNKVDAAIWDVLRKPGISPKGVAKKDVEAVLATRAYFNRDLAPEEMDEFEGQEEKRETLTMYAARLAWDCSYERPDWYFARRNVTRLDGEIQEYAQELWEHGQDILAVRSNGRHLRNGGACMLYKTPCKFLGLCSRHDTIDSGAWQERSWVHPELPILPGRGTDILTNSRIRTFQTCRRKHQLQYEIGLEKIDEEEREALFFGNLFHEASERYFITLMNQHAKGIL